MSIKSHSNIAEGSSRKSIKEFMRFLDIAKGSLAALETQIFIARELTMLSPKDVTHLTASGHEISKMIHGLRNSLKEKKIEKTKLKLLSP